MQLTLAALKARIERLDRLARGLAREVGLQRGAQRRAVVPLPPSTVLGEST